MDKTIKTRDVVKDIKVLDKKSALTNAVRSSHTKTKEAVEQPAGDNGQQQHKNGNDYALDKTEQSAKTGAEIVGRDTVKGSKKTYDTMRDAHSTSKDVKQTAQSAQQATNTARQQTLQAVSKQSAKNTTVRTATTARQTAATSKQAAAASGKTAKGTVKTASKSIKTAGATAKTTVKTSRATAQSAKAAAKGTQIAARNAANAARVAAKASAAAAKATVKGIAAFAKMAIAAIKSLVSAIAAGGWVAVAVILIICLVGLIATSAFGIFFAGGDMGDGNPTLREVVATVNQEHQEKIDQVKADNTYDDLIMTGTRAPWKEVLSVYSVRATTDPDNPLDAITLDDRRQQILRDVFWAMNTIDLRIEDREVTEIIAVEQPDGSWAEEYQTSTRRTLIIVQSSKSADEMATTYAFTAKQIELLHELLTSAYASAWQSVLYGTHNGSGDIVEVAITQIGNVGGQPYWSWYGFGGRVEWCACFVSWCANECGYIEAGLIPKFSYCPSGVQWFKDAGCWQDRGYVPQPGDIIFFDWQGDGESDHVGIVESCDGATIHTIEGNSGDACRRSSYSINSSSVLGVGTPRY